MAKRQLGNAPNPGAKSTAMALDAEAREQWKQFLEEYAQGVKFSDLPRYFMINVKNGGRNGFTTFSTDGLERDPSQWGTISEQLLLVARAWEPSFELPRGWSYKRLVQGITINNFDFPNERYYTLDGKLIPWVERPGLMHDMASVLKESFPHVLSNLFTSTPPNLRRPIVKEFLDYHLKEGGDPMAFKDLVEATQMLWLNNAPKEPFIWTKGRTEIIDGWDTLRGFIEDWLSDARTKPTTSAKPVQFAKPRTMAERLNAVSGAREAFDTGLLRDGIMNEAGQCILKSRKGKAQIIAAWDAVVQIFEVNGYPPGLKGDEELSDALMGYIHGLRIGKRLSNSRNDSKKSAYGKALKSWRDFLSERRNQTI